MNRLPNILITGTPGTGKTSTAQTLAKALNYSHINVGDIVKDKDLHEGKDKEFDAFILDEDKVCDELEPIMEKGGNIVDFHSCDFFPERWFDLVIVLRADNGVLYERLRKRGYNEKKLTENMEAEIMQVCLDEAREGYDKNIIVELKSNTIADLEENVRRTVEWVKNKLS